MTRRRFLKTAGAVAVGGLALGAADVIRGWPVALQAPAALPTFRTFVSRPDLAPPLIESTGRANDIARGLIFLTPANGEGQNGPMIVDDRGELVWMRPGNGKLVADLRVAAYQGRPVLTWWEGSEVGGIGSGEHVVLDASYREITRIEAANGRQADLHELLLTPEGTALFFADAALKPRLPGDATAGSQSIMDCSIQEIDLASGRLLFEWHTADHIAIAESTVGPPAGANGVYDYVHANSIDVDADGDLIMSDRNTSAIYKIDRRTGRIIWRLDGTRSDFTMGHGTRFAFQHDARRQPDGTLTVFDDGAGGSSRAIVLRLDEKAMTATLVREYVQPHGLFATSQGNMQVLPNGNVFVGWGSLPRYSEFSREGALLADATFTASQSYRDYRFPWVGAPTDAPAIVVQKGGAALTVYVSWNGATEIASWDVVAGAGAGDLAHVASAPKSGFETAVNLATTQPFVAVRALDASGVLLGTSPLAATT
jgi:hypothetical protein